MTVACKLSILKMAESNFRCAMREIVTMMKSVSCIMLCDTLSR